MDMYPIYQVLHFAGILLVFAALGAIAFNAAAPRGLVGTLHGVGLLLVLVGGFGMLARLGIHDFPGWVLVKGGAWLLLGAALPLLRRKAAAARALLLVCLAVGVVAAYTAFTNGIN